MGAPANLPTARHVRAGHGDWGGRWGSNPRPLDPQSRALPAELRPPLMRIVTEGASYHRSPHRSPHRKGAGTPGRTRTCNRRLRRPMLYPVELRAQSVRRGRGVVGVGRFELPTSCSQSRRAARLRHTPPGSPSLGFSRPPPRERPAIIMGRRRTVKRGATAAMAPSGAAGGGRIRARPAEMRRRWCAFRQARLSAAGPLA